MYKYLLKYIFFLLFISINSLASDIVFLCTAALIDNQYEMRKKEYEEVLSQIKAYGYPIYVVEAIKNSGPTFLDSYGDYIYYSRVNNIYLRNKGINEARSMFEALRYFDINDDVLVVKLTGRYCFMSDLFMNMVMNNTQYDGFIKPIDNNTQYFTGCFALRARYLKEFLMQLDYDRMEYYMINVEKEFKEYIDRKQLNINYVHYLDLKVNSFGIGNCQLMMY
jgi:hypothetical protein